MQIITIIRKWHTARKHVIGKSEILNNYIIVREDFHAE